MLVTLKRGVDPERVQSDLQRMGLWSRRLRGGDGGHALSVEAPSPPIRAEKLRAIEGVADVLLGPSAHPLVDGLSRRAAGRSGLIERLLGAASPALVAGPCAVESAEGIEEIAARVAAAGGTALRGGAFKPRTSPHAFAGVGERALRWLRAAANRHQLRVVTEVLSEHDVERVSAVADLLQLGSRNMSNVALLRAAGRAGKPVLLKRGMAATVGEWLLAGEHLLAAGAPEIVFCERGVRGFDPSTRNLLDLGAVALLAEVYRLPVLVDPSHAAGRRDLVLPLSRAALAAGADGLLVEVHPDPGLARSDGPQALPAERLPELAGICADARRERAR